MSRHWRQQFIIVVVSLLGMVTVGMVSNLNAGAPSLATAPAATPAVISAQITPAPTATPRPSQQLAHAVVTKREDTDDGLCTPTDCSLREAIANVADGGEVTFAEEAWGKLLLQRELVIQSVVRLSGVEPKSKIVTLSADHGGFMFRVFPTGSLQVKLISLTLEPRLYGGGGIVVENGSLSVVGSTIHHIRGNNAILNSNGIVHIENSTFHHNRGTNGGAITNLQGEMFIRNSTFFGNVATVGGAIFNSGKLHVSFTTFAENTATGGHTFGNGGVIDVDNSIISGSTDKKVAVYSFHLNGCAGILPVDKGGNIQFPGNDCGASIVHIDPKLGTLAENGGPTQTVTLLNNSPAIDFAIPSLCESSVSNRDQRGMPRSDRQCDIGAFEK